MLGVQFLRGRKTPPYRMKLTIKYTNGCVVTINLVGGNSNIFGIFTPIPGGNDSI